MPYTVLQLIKGTHSSNPVAIEQHASVQKALNIMIENQYSQLPVVEKEMHLIGKEQFAYMVTNDSITRALSILEVIPKKLKVSDAMIKVRAYRPEDDLFDLLKDLRDTNAVPIMDGSRKLVGVVTSYDTTEYFRKRAEDMMHIEEIEKTLKEYISAYFTDQSGEIDHAARNAAIDDIMPSNKKEIRGPFQRALQNYLELQGAGETQIKNDLVEQVFERYLYRKETAESFDKLTFDDYIRLFLHEDRWERYQRVFSIDRQYIKKLLEDVRDTRNAVAHFRIETITDEQRDKIQFCKDWLESFNSGIKEDFRVDITPPMPRHETSIWESHNEKPLVGADTMKADTVAVSQLAEETPHDSRYAPLATWLQEQPIDDKTVPLSFQQIETIIGDALPASAREVRSWWANDSVGHVQSQQWLEVGWRVSNIYMAEETVIFTRIKDREKAYIDFYSGLLPMLTKAAQFHVREASPDGLNWIIIGRVPSRGPQTAFLAFSFARRGRIRVELYIDTGDKTRNKALFDALDQRKVLIQRDLAGISGSLEWERINDKRASRIALYHKGAITDSTEYLASLREWAVDAMIKFQRVMERHISEIL
jgi:CBS domain-containing protein